MKRVLNEIFLPFGRVNKQVNIAIYVFWLTLAVVLAGMFHNPMIPSPLKILDSFVKLLGQKETWEAFVSSLEFTLTGMFYSLLVTMAFVYLQPIPFFRPFAQVTSKFRYATLSGVVFLFTVLSSDVDGLKMKLLLFGIIPFFVTSFLSVLNGMNEQEVHKARVNRMSRWEALYEVIIYGKFDQVYDVMRQNFAIAWIIITSVEGLAMSRGGLGTLFIKAGRVLAMDTVFALLLLVLLTGTLFDFLFYYSRKMIFAHVKQD